MSVIPTSQLSLMRKRREMKASIESGDWNSVLQLEADLFDEIDKAVSDPQRSPKDLLNELGSVVKVYRELSELCQFNGQSLQNPL